MDCRPLGAVGGAAADALRRGLGACRQPGRRRADRPRSLPLRPSAPDLRATGARGDNRRLAALPHRRTAYLHGVHSAGHRSASTRAEWRARVAGTGRLPPAAVRIRQALPRGVHGRRPNAATG